MTKKKDIGTQAKEGLVWTLFFQAVQFVLRMASSIILARVLFPEDFGLMALASIVIQLARRFGNFGFGMVLVQLKEVKREHFDTVFIINTLLMGTVATGIFFCSSYIADFFNNVRLAPIVQVLAFDFFLRNLASVPGAVLRRDMRFMETNFSDTVGRAILIITTVVLALMGHGVWSIVYGTLAGTTANVLQLWAYSRWYPTFRFTMWALKDCFSFGLWVWFTVFVNFGINKVDYFFIGKLLNVTQLGFYERAFDLMSLPRKRLVRQINTVAFATYSRVQDDDKRLIRGLLKVIRYTSIVSYPLMGWLFLSAPAFIPVVYGEKWIPAVLPLQIMCISGLFDSFTMLFEPLLQARGWVGNHARRKVAYLAVLTMMVLLGIKWEIAGVAVGVALASVFHLSLMLQITRSRLPVTLAAFVAAQRPAITYTAMMVGAVMLLKWGLTGYVEAQSATMLILITIVAPLTYLGAHLLLRFSEVDDILNEIFSGIRKLLRKVPIVKNFGFVQKKG